VDELERIARIVCAALTEAGIPFGPGACDTPTDRGGYIYDVGDGVKIDIHLAPVPPSTSPQETIP